MKIRKDRTRLSELCDMAAPFGWRVGDMGAPWLARRLLIAISIGAVQISMHDFFKGPLHLFFKRRADLF